MKKQTNKKITAHLPSILTEQRETNKPVKSGTEGGAFATGRRQSFLFCCLIKKAAAASPSCSMTG